MDQINLTYPEPDESSVPQSARWPDRPLTPAEMRGRMQERRNFIRKSQAAGLTPMRPPGPGHMPGRILREDYEFVRVPCRQSEKAKELLATSGRPAALFPQALQEAFGDLGGIREVLIGAVPKHKHFTVYVDELHPVTGEPPMLIVITIIPKDESLKNGRFFINHKDLYEINPKTREPYFSAMHCAYELARLYDQGVR